MCSSDLFWAILADVRDEIGDWSPDEDSDDEDESDEDESDNRKWVVVWATEHDAGAFPQRYDTEAAAEAAGKAWADESNARDGGDFYSYEVRPADDDSHEHDGEQRHYRSQE